MSADVDALNDLVVAITAAGFNCSIGVPSHSYGNKDVVIGMPTLTYQSGVCPSGRVHTTEVAVFAHGQQPEHLVTLLDDTVAVADAVNATLKQTVTGAEPGTVDDVPVYVITSERPI